MRKRLSLLLVVLIGAVMISLGVPLANSIAAEQGRLLFSSRMADLSYFASLVPSAVDSSDPDATAAARIATAALTQDLQRYNDLYGIEVTFVDATGQAEFGGRPAGEPVEVQPQAQTEVAAALLGRTSSQPAHLLAWQTGPLVVAQPVIRDGDQVGAMVSVSSTERARARVLRQWIRLAVIELLAMCAAVAVAIGLARWLLHPVARLDETVQQISAGDLSARVLVGSGPPELRRLEGRFNEMAANVEQAVKAQRAFVADASHQLRNPLAALLLRLQTLPLVPPDQVTGIAESALSDGENLASSLDRMLALARIEHAGASAEEFDIAALVDERLASWRVVAQGRSIEIERIGELHATGVHEPTAVAGALDAVLDNSLKYSPEDSRITVDVTVDGGTSVIQVTDDGPGVAEQDLPRLGERFFRAERTAHQKGSGLGVSIARKLLAQHGGRLEMTPSPDRGLCVRLEISRAKH